MRKHGEATLVAALGVLLSRCLELHFASGLCSIGAARRLLLHGRDQLLAHRQKRGVDVGGGLGARLQKTDAQLLGELRRRLLTHLLQIRQIGLKHMQQQCS